MGGVAGLYSSRWLLPKLPDPAGVWGATRPAGPCDWPPADAQPPHRAPLALLPPHTFFLSQPWTPSLSYRWGHPGALRPGRAAETRELKPNICVYNAFSEAHSCRNKGKKERSGERPCHMQMTVCAGLFSFSFSGNPGALLPVPLSHCLTIVPALGTAGDGGPRRAGRPLLTRRPSRPTAGGPRRPLRAPPGQTALATPSPSRPARAELAPRPVSSPPCPSGAAPKTCPAVALLSGKRRGQGSGEGVVNRHESSACLPV